MRSRTDLSRTSAISTTSVPTARLPSSSRYFQRSPSRGSQAGRASAGAAACAGAALVAAGAAAASRRSRLRLASSAIHSAGTAKLAPSPWRNCGVRMPTSFAFWSNTPPPEEGPLNGASIWISRPLAPGVSRNPETMVRLMVRSMPRGALMVNKSCPDSNAVAAMVAGLPDGSASSMCNWHRSRSLSSNCSLALRSALPWVTTMSAAPSTTLQLVTISSAAMSTPLPRVFFSPLASAASTTTTLGSASLNTSRASSAYPFADSSMPIVQSSQAPERCKSAVTLPGFVISQSRTIPIHTIRCLPTRPEGNQSGYAF